MPKNPFTNLTTHGSRCFQNSLIEILFISVLNLCTVNPKLNCDYIKLKDVFYLFFVVETRNCDYIKSS